MSGLRIFYVICLFFNYLLSAQNNTPSQRLKIKVEKNSKLYQQNIDKAYLEIDFLLKESLAVKDSISEMKLLDRKCRYFYNKNMMDSLIITCEKLQKRAGNYQNIYYEAMSNIYMAEIYSINNFPDKAIKHLNSAYTILQKDHSESKKIFYAKANVLSSFANVYLDKNLPHEAAKKIYEEIESGKTISNKQERDQFQYLNYANLANIYTQINSDSAYHYAKKSILIKPSNSANDQSMIDNYSVIGKVYKEKGDYKNALENFHKALFISKKNGTELNANSIYHSLKETYQILKMEDSVAFYKDKIEKSDLKTLRSKYNSLQEVINKDKKEGEKNTEALWYLLVPVITAVIFGVILTGKKKKSQETPEQKADVNLSETFHQLMELLEKRDPAFMFTFEQVYPDFSQKLLAKNNDLQQSELEFCALLKMKLSTKEIAKLSFIETRTVQNKKYRLRKKLDIPHNVDIYQWIDQI